MGFKFDVSGKEFIYKFAEEVDYRNERASFKKDSCFHRLHLRNHTPFSDHSKESSGLKSPPDLKCKKSKLADSSARNPEIPVATSRR